MTALTKVYGLTVGILLILSLIVAGYIISRDHPYRPGDKIGYNLGLAGGVMMLSLLLYPLRKRISFMNNWSILPKWFRWHMVLGMLGPTLILFHSTFEIASYNSGAAFIFTSVVTGSGIFGRFVYTKVHVNQHDRQAWNQLLQKEIEEYADSQTNTDIAPVIQQKLIRFRDCAMNSSRADKLQMWNFMTLGMRAKMLSRQLITQLNDAMYADANMAIRSEMPTGQFDEIFSRRKSFIQAYLNAVQHHAQYETYGNILSLWNILHIPPVYLLVFSAIWHVIAVHMY